MDSNQMERIGQFRKAIFKMAVSYNKTLTERVIEIKAESLSDSLKSLPTHKIADFFNKLSTVFDLMPTDPQIRAYLGAFNGGSQNHHQTQYSTVYGYFDIYGCYVPNGTFHSFREAPDALLSEVQRNTRRAYYKAKPGEEPKELMEAMAKFDELRFPYQKGKVQKHRSQWNFKDYQTAGIEPPIGFEDWSKKS